MIGQAETSYLVKGVAAARSRFIDGRPLIPKVRWKIGQGMSIVDGLEMRPIRSVLGRGVVKVRGRDGNVNFTLEDEMPISQVEDGLRYYLGESHGWFRGGAVTVDVGRRLLSPDELRRLREIFEEEFQVKVASFSCQAETLVKAISQEAEVPVNLVLPQGRSAAAPREHQGPEDPLFVKKTCRSGTVIRHNGDVVILGDVNPGAEVTSTEDIIVLGTLRGNAHAGSDGGDPTSAVIMALSLQPLQLRIGQHFWVAPSDARKRAMPAYPEIAFVSGGSIVVVPFNGKFQRKEKRSLR